jgi:hypothetical protein
MSYNCLGHCCGKAGAMWPLQQPLQKRVCGRCWENAQLSCVAQGGLFSKLWSLLLEGGYNLATSAASAEACVRALLGERPAPLRGTR